MDEDLFERALREDAAALAEALSQGPPVVCRGYWSHTTSGSDFDCEHAHGEIGCSNCVVNGGSLDPRTGKRFRTARPRRKRR